MKTKSESKFLYQQERDQWNYCELFSVSHLQKNIATLSENIDGFFLLIDIEMGKYMLALNESVERANSMYGRHMLN